MLVHVFCPIRIGAVSQPGSSNLFLPQLYTNYSVKTSTLSLP